MIFFPHTLVTEFSAVLTRERNLKIASLKTINYLEERAKRGSVDDMLAILSSVPDVEPDNYDKL